MVGPHYGRRRLAPPRGLRWTRAPLGRLHPGPDGGLVAVFPNAWLGLFTNDADVLATGTAYLRIVGPSYGAIGLGLLLYFASQGAGRVLWPVLGGTARLVIAAVVGWAAVAWLNVGESALFALVAVATLVFGAINAAAILWGAWER